MYVTANREKAQPLQPVTGGRYYQARIVGEPIWDEEKPSLEVKMELQLPLDMQGLFESAVRHTIPFNPISGWSTAQFFQLVDAFGVPGDGDNYELADFDGRTGKVFVEQRRDEFGQVEAYVAKCVPS